jgi:hypothetical protein
MDFISERYNASEGDKHLEDGYECAECKNKGFVSEVRLGDLGYCEFMRECKCMKIRRAIKRLDRSGLKDAGKNAVELFTKMMCTPEPADSTVTEEPKAEEE